MERVFVTGGSGFIGRHLVAALLSAGHAVTNYDIARAPRGAENVVGDVCDYERLARAMRGHSIVCHLAAMVGVVACQEQERRVVDCNYTGAANVLRACREHGISRIVCASSSEVYGEGRGRSALRESDEPAPRSLYGKTKLWAEQLAREHAEACRARIAVLRYCNVYGPGQRPVFVVPLFIGRALRGEPLLLCRGGGQVRNYTYVGDAVRGTIAAMERLPDGCEVYNICSGHSLSVRELAGKVIALNGGAGACEDVGYGDLGRRADYEIEVRMPSGDKARDGLGFVARTGIDEGLEKTMDAYREVLARER